MTNLTPPDPAHPIIDPIDAQAITSTLTKAYGLTPLDVRRLPIGDATVNYRAVCTERTVFVKCYPPKTDLGAERRAIELSEIAGQVAVPVARVLPSRAGEMLAPHGKLAVSVWDFIDGRTIATGLNRAQLQATGAALGCLHRRFAILPASRGPASQTRAWLSVDLSEVARTIDQLLSIIAARAAPDDFDAAAARTLHERRVALAHVPALLAAVPPLTSQVLHGDYSVLNLLFSGDDLAAVIDFRPPDPFLISYELGRIAFDPRAVALTPDWLEGACVVIDAYLAANPRVSPNDVAYAGRIWLVQLLTSLYGVKGHYLQAGLLQGDLDAFWLLRHRAAQVLWEQLADVEDALRSYRPARSD